MRPAERDVLLLSEPDVTMGDFLARVHVRPGGMLDSPTLPIQTPIDHFFSGAPDQEL